MRAWRFRSVDADQTEACGAALGAALELGDLVRLHGELGSGKTTFCRGIGRGLGIAEPLSSPTYLLCREYPLPQGGALLHLDAYFTERLDSLLGEGLAERLDGRVIVLVEWAERVAGWLPADGLDLDLAAVGSAAPGLDPGEAGLRHLRVRVAGAQAGRTWDRWRGKLAAAGISVEPEEEPDR